MELKANNIILISINQRNKVDRGCIRKTSKYKKCEELLQFLLQNSIDIQPVPRYTSDITLRIDLETYLDVDNPVKMIIDALCKIGIIANDREVIKLIVCKKAIKRGQPSSIKIKVLGSFKW